MPNMNAARSRRLILFTLLAVVPIGAIVWQFVLKDRIVAKRWGVVEPGRIYRSGQLSRHLVRRMLEDHRIRVVVDLTEIDLHDADQSAERDALRQLGIESRRFPLVGDGTGDLRQYAAAIRAICTAVASGKPVLVHCHAGAQRPGGVIAAYRLLVQHRSPEEARREMIRYGWDPGRDAVLLDYLNTHLAELANLLAADRVITSVPDEVPHL
jgi:protein tyrosine phosphatase (PTP) superfamily phosphohydrolase (DUF442 family)